MAHGGKPERTFVEHGHLVDSHLVPAEQYSRPRESHLNSISSVVFNKSILSGSVLYPY